MFMKGVEIHIVEDGHVFIDPVTGQSLVVKEGNMVNQNGRKIFCVQPDYDKLLAAIKPITR